MKFFMLLVLLSCASAPETDWNEEDDQDLKYLTNDKYLMNDKAPQKPYINKKKIRK